MNSQTLTVLPLEVGAQEQRTGLLAAFATVVVWSLYFVSLKLGAVSPLSAVDLALLRFTIPALILSGVFWRSLSCYRALPWLYKLGIIFGGGLPFFLASASAMKASGVLFGSTLIPGASPLFVTLIAIVVFKQPLPKKRLFGLSAIVLGTLALLVGAWLTSETKVFKGALMFVGCAFSWALFTISVRQSQLRPIQVAALAAIPNGVFIAAYIFISDAELMLLTIPVNELIAQVAIQGLCVGIFSGLFYSYAITKLGAEKTSSIGSLTPILSTLIAITFLQESLEIIPLLGLCLTAAGVILASRAQTH